MGITSKSLGKVTQKAVLPDLKKLTITDVTLGTHHKQAMKEIEPGTGPATGGTDPSSVAKRTEASSSKRSVKPVKKKRAVVTKSKKKLTAWDKLPTSFT